MVFQAKERPNAKVLNWGRALSAGDGGQGWHCMGLMRSAGPVLLCILVSVLPENFSPLACVVVRDVCMFVVPTSLLLLFLCTEMLVGYLNKWQPTLGSNTLFPSLVTFATLLAQSVLKCTI